MILRNNIGYKHSVAIAMTATALSTLPIMLVGGLAPLMREEVPTPLGLLVAACFATAAVSALPTGYLVNRLGAEAALRLGAALTSVALLGLTFVADTAHLVAATVIAGAGLAATQVASNQMLSDLIPANRQGFAYGMKQASVPLSSLLAGASVPLIGLTVGWRGAFLFGAIVALVFSVRLPVRSTSHSPAHRTGVWNRQVLRIIPLAAGSAFGSASVTPMAPFFIDWATHVQITLADSGLLLVAGSCLGIGMRLTIGWITDRYAIPVLRTAAILLLSGSVGLVMMAVGQPLAFKLVGVAIAFSGVWGWAGLVWLAAARDTFASGRVADMSMSVVQLGTMTGGIVGPLVFGYSVESQTYSIAWLTLAASSALASILMIIGQKTLHPQ